MIRTTLKVSSVATTLALSCVGFALFTAVTACTVRTPTTETPVPNNHGIEKSFFVEMTPGVSADGAAVTKMKPKTFLCDWAPISESGAIASSFLGHAVHMGSHCNMEFEITSNALVGRLVNPSFPNDRSRWKPALTIPIRSHYYYERAKDSYGRETNEFIENSSRSDFSARPMMDLSLDDISIDDWNLALFHNSRNGKITSVQDVEWDKANGFLAFTASVTNSEWGSDIAAHVRFNFKAFEHNEKFQPTPYSPRNSKHFNALHVIGEKVDGVSQIWSAAKWDLSKTHDIYTHGFPDEYAYIPEKVISEWNAALVKIGKPAAFRLNKTKMKYPFDLRYPMMVWVEDAQISAQSPLGIGMAQADVRNGEILWGQITLYGGGLENYVKSNLGPSSPTDGAAASAMLAGTPQVPAFFQTYFNPRKALQPPPGFGPGSFERLQARLNSVAMNPSIDDFANRLVKEQAVKTGQAPTAAALAAARAEATETVSKEMAQREKAFRERFSSTIADFQARIDRTADVRNGTRQLFGFPNEPSTETRRRVFGNDEHTMTGRQKLTKLTASSAEDLRRSSGGAVYDADRRLIDVGPNIMAGIAQSGVSYEAGLRKAMLELTLHEFGHLMGLGHQFKENILPADGSVPEKYLVELKKSALKNLTNSTSVMGYKSGITEVLQDEEQIKPGPQDLLTLRYLYNQEYATYRKGADDFQYAKVPANGIIPVADPEHPEFITSYFPQCNDFDASFGADPYCNRWDRGYDAATIVKNYIDELNANLVSRIYAFTDVRGGNTEGAEGYLWFRAASNLGRVRTFYDYMRQKYETEIRSISNNERDLYEFSRVCTGEVEGSKKLQDLFKVTPELKALCIVNRYAVKEMTKLMSLPGPDRSRMDWDSAQTSAQVTGGDADTDYSRAFGAHTALSVMPLKLAAANALTTPYPYTMLGDWMFPVARYTGGDGLFSYSSLYPFEVTEAFASAVEKNLKFTSIASDWPTIGLPVASMGHFLEQQMYANDATRLPKNFIENIRNQANFRLSLKAIILKAQTRTDKTRVTHFVAELYDPATDKPQALGEPFVLPGGKLIVRPGDRNFLYPITDIMFVSNTVAYVFAYHVEYDDKYDDLLAAHSVKATLQTLNKAILDSCIIGDKDGLSSFFSAQKQDEAKFPGFLVLDGIAVNKEQQIVFLNSVKENFAKYYEASKRPNGQGPTAERCENADRSLRMIIGTAGLLNGYFLPEVLDYLVK